MVSCRLLYVLCFALLCASCAVQAPNPVATVKEIQSWSTSRPEPPDDQTLALVQKGAQLLDEASPGWEHQINTYKLDMRSDQRSILGQLYGSNMEGRNRLNLAEFDDIRCGFDTLGYWFLLSDPNDPAIREYAETESRERPVRLRDAWQYLIYVRKN
jgi:hypothetical protein